MQLASQHIILMTEDREASFVVSCPAKIILHGEHAVVYGKTALATSINLRTNATLTSSSPLNLKCVTITFQMPQLSIDVSWPIDEIAAKVCDQPSNEILEILKEFAYRTDPDSNSNAFVASLVFLYLFATLCIDTCFKKDARIIVKSGAPLGSGLGSSAALSVCISTLFLLLSGKISFPSQASLNLDLLELSNALSSNLLKSTPFSGECLALINKWAFAGESIIHGTASGIDNTLCTHGGTIRFRDGEFGTINGFSSITSLSLVVIDSHIPKSTSKMVSLVKERKNRIPEVIEPIFTSIDSISECCSQEFNRIIKEKSLPDFKLLEELIFVNHQLLCAIGVSHPQLEKVITIAEENGFRAKLTGAGGGGCLVALITPQNEDRVGAFRESLSGSGFKSWVTRFGVEGISFHHL